MKLVMAHPAARNTSYRTSLFKMQTDQLSFERFEELFDGEDEEMTELPKFDDEWKRCNVNNPKR